jgi:hypothetical protein
MVYTFETLDGEKFVLDIEKSRWGRASSILAAPSVAATENAIARYVYVEEGELVPMGGGVYNFDGRMPLPEKATEEEKKAPGAGLSSVGVLIVLYGEVCEVYLKPNVPIKDGSFDSGYLRELEPSIRNKFLRHNILQEPPKVEEKKLVEETQ